MTSSEARRSVRLAMGVLLALPLAACGGGSASHQGPTGSLRFGAVTLPSEGEAGRPVALSAEIASDTDQVNVTVSLALVKTDDPSSVDPRSFKPWAHVWGTVIERVNAGTPVTVQTSFDVPPDLEAGTYAAVLEVGALAFNAAADALQGEESATQGSDVVVGAAPLRITVPPLPDLEVAAVALDRYGFDLQAPVIYGADAELFGAGVTVLARTHDVADPVVLGFELGVPGASGGTSWYPLEVGAAGAGGQYAGPLAEYTLQPEAQLDDDDLEHTVALLANRPRSFQVGLHAPEAAQTALAALAGETPCQLRVTVDPAGALAESDETDNAVALPLTFFPQGFHDGGGGPPAAGDAITPGVPAANVVKDWSRKQDFGNDTFAASYLLDAAFSLKEDDPAAGHDLRFSSKAVASITLLGEDFTAADVRTVGNLDPDVADANVFAASAEAFGRQLLSKRATFAVDGGTVVLYQCDKELYSSSKTKTKTFLLGGMVPMTVTGTASLEVGLDGAATAGPDRRLSLELTPWFDVTGTADASIHLGIASGGVTGDLRFLKVEDQLANAIMLRDDFTRHYQAGDTLTLQTLDGDVYLHARTAVGCKAFAASPCHFKKTLLKWSGYTKTFTIPIASFDL